MSPKTDNYGRENLGYGDGRFLQKNLGFGVGFGYRNNTNDSKRQTVWSSQRSLWQRAMWLCYAACQFCQMS